MLSPSRFLDAVAPLSFRNTHHILTLLPMACRALLHLYFCSARFVPSLRPFFASFAACCMGESKVFDLSARSYDECISRCSDPLAQTLALDTIMVFVCCVMD